MHPPPPQLTITKRIWYLHTQPEQTDWADRRPLPCGKRDWGCRDKWVREVNASRVRERDGARDREMGTVGAAAEVIRLVSNSYCVHRFGCHSFGRLFIVFFKDQKMYRAMCLLLIAPITITVNISKSGSGLLKWCQHCQRAKNKTKTHRWAIWQKSDQEDNGRRQQNGGDVQRRKPEK